jgi:hypothetical protein
MCLNSLGYPINWPICPNALQYLSNWPGPIPSKFSTSNPPSRNAFFTHKGAFSSPLQLVFMTKIPCHLPPTCVPIIKVNINRPPCTLDQLTMIRVHRPCGTQSSITRTSTVTRAIMVNINHFPPTCD